MAAASSDDQEEVRAGFDRVCGVGRFSVDDVVERADSSLQRKCESAGRDAGDSRDIRVSVGDVFLADADRRRARRREAGGLEFDQRKIDSAIEPF